MSCSNCVRCLNAAKARWRSLLPGVCALWGGMALAQPFTPHEQAWIEQHPVVRYAIDPYWPMEYYDTRGGHQGLTREYIDYIEQVTGLTFELVPSPDFQHTLGMIAKGELDAVSAVSVRLLDEEARRQLLFSDPYFVGASVIMTKAASPIAYSPAKLAGQLVAVKGGGGYERYLSRHYPGIHLLLLNDPEAALAAVDEGHADAVIGLDQVLRPLVRRKYFDQLHLSGILSDMPSVIAMGIAPGEPLLKSIIDKALGGLTSRETDQMEARWIANTDFGAPSWSSLLRYYRWELAAAVVCVLLLAAFARHAQRARRAAQQSEGVKTAFLAMMSHEIRTPMNAIVSSLELLRRTPLQPRQEQLTSLASHSAGNLLELLDNVLDLSRLEARHVELDPQPANLWELASAVADIHRLAAQAKGIALRLHTVGPEQAVVEIDAMRLRQILGNLLSNAVKFTEQGQVDLHLTLAEQPPTELRIDVVDTGIGISPAQQARLFTPFVQADSSTTRRYGGSGLGLAICRDLARLMGGEIGLRSVPGQGTTVWLRLPVRVLDGVAPAGPSPMPPMTDTAPMADRPCLLLVEDHPVNQQAIALQLHTLGYRHVLAADGPAALAVLAEGGIDGVLLDCNLPGMDGYEVATRIRAREAEWGHERLPILAISAANDDAHRERVFAHDMDGSLSKPLRLAELEDLLAMWIAPVGAFQAAAPENALRTLFMGTSEADVLDIEAALRAGDLPEVAHRAHRILGAALMVGASEVAEVAGALEARLADNPGQAPEPHLLGRLRAALARFSEAGD